MAENTGSAAASQTSAFKLTMQLAKNDFKTKYAGSYLGIIWAFIQPVVTILVYWFVFSTVRSGSERQVPFVLWLIAGLIPWFFFSDSMNTGANALVDYSYLVKKVVFRIEILPGVKIVSALFVHLFFIAVLIFLYAVMGYFPGLSVLQVFYYTFCVFVLVMCCSRLTCAVVVFFRDLTQIISICLQVGIWLTPIMWNFEDLHVGGTLRAIFTLNPMYYVVEGYRDAMITGVWFWEKPGLTIYYWSLCLVVGLLARSVFSKLRVHFADVL